MPRGSLSLSLSDVRFNLSQVPIVTITTMNQRERNYDFNRIVEQKCKSASLLFSKAFIYKAFAPSLSLSLSL